MVEVYKPKNYIRVVTATSLFDGHDAAINIMRRILQDSEWKLSTWGITDPCRKLWMPQLKRMLKA